MKFHYGEIVQIIKLKRVGDAFKDHPFAPFAPVMVRATGSERQPIHLLQLGLLLLLVT